MADAPDLGSGAARRGGSSPFTRTKKFSEPRGVWSMNEPTSYTLSELVEEMNPDSFPDLVDFGEPVGLEAEK